MSVKEHKILKRLRPNDSLRNNMQSVEHTLVEIAERSAREIAQATGVKGLAEMESVCNDGCKIASFARQVMERRAKIDFSKSPSLEIDLAALNL